MDYGAHPAEHRAVPNLSSHRQHASLVKLGAAIQKLRREQGVSQEQLALIAEVDRSYVGRIERGDNNVALLTLLKVAAALGVSGADLLKLAKL